MAKASKTWVTAVIIIVAVAAVYGVKTFVLAGPAVESSSDRDKIKGNSDAPLKIVEFIDFECPACAVGSMYLKETMDKHPDLIQLKVKYFPLQMHRHGMLSAQYAECAARQSRFWEFHDLLYARQNNWKRLADATEAFDQIAHEAGLNSGELKACLDNSLPNGTIADSRNEGVRRGIRSTPTYFVNGDMVVGMKSLEIEINKYLENNGG